MDTLARISETRLIPMLSPKKPELTLPLLAALCSGGISAAEFSMEVPFTPDAISSGSRLFPDLVLGAGAVTSLSLARTAISAGARYISSPGYSKKMAELCKEHGILYLPQCTTLSELLAAAQNGLSGAGLFAPHLWASDEMLKEFTAAFPKLTILACRIPHSDAPHLLSLPRIAACTLTGLNAESPEALADHCRQLTSRLEHA
jgi:2-dehydro-3-deoxyphosphogluconate aldolase/(4S)-4-hydroxy-2-oxoglutarate aldolase